MNPTHYILTLLQELERLLPAPFSPNENHAITWICVEDDAGAERDALVILRNVGDCLFPYRCRRPVVYRYHISCGPKPAAPGRSLTAENP
jgi:hypothetical protein